MSKKEKGDQNKNNSVKKDSFLSDILLTAVGTHELTIVSSKELFIVYVVLNVKFQS